MRLKVGLLLTVLLLGAIAETAQAQVQVRIGRGGYGRGYYGPGYYPGRGYYGGNYGGYGYRRFGGPYYYPGLRFNYPNYTYGSSYYYPGTTYYSSPSTTTYYDSDSYPASPTVDPNSALIRVTVPEGDADLFLQGQKMSTGGTYREFVSPALQPGNKYTYDVRATWNQAGKQVTQEKKVEVMAGQEITIDFGAQQSSSVNGLY